MPKVEKVKKAPVHLCTKTNLEKMIWRTACGLKLDKADRKDVILADDLEHTTCKACKQA